MEKMKKVTKRENFTAIKDILDGLGRTDLVAVMEHELELLAKKNSADRKPTKAQEINESLKAEMLTHFEKIGKPCTISELMKSMPTTFEGIDLSNQKLSALANRMVDEGKLIKTIDKRKSLFAIA